MSWMIVYKDKKLGSLGIRKLEVLNQALLSDWLWRYAHEQNNLWRKIIQNKFEAIDGGGFSLFCPYMHAIMCLHSDAYYAFHASH